MSFHPIQAAFMALTLSLGLQIVLPTVLTLLADTLLGTDLKGQAQHPGQFKGIETAVYKVIIILTQTLGIGVVAFGVAYGSGDTLKELRLKMPANPILIALAVACMLVALPFIQYTVFSPDNFRLPEAFRGLEDAMREMEAANERMLTPLLATGLPLTLAAIALTPGIMEELLFRGVIQSSFARRVSPHVAIWLAAILFSTIHFQVYGFLGRALLGAGFGYLCWWSGSIWPAIAAHATNNAVSAVAAYLNTQGTAPEITDENASVPIWAALLSLAATLGLLRVFRKQSEKSYDAYSDPYNDSRNDES